MAALRRKKKAEPDKGYTMVVDSFHHVSVCVSTFSFSGHLDVTN